MIHGKTEALYLVDDSAYLHVWAVDHDPFKAFAYEAVDAVSMLRTESGMLDPLVITEMPQKSSLVCARLLAMQEIGLDGEKVQEISLKMLEKFKKKGRDSRRDHSVRFINSRYDELFHIPDGGTIQVRYPDRVFSQRCEYMDDYHTRIGGTVFHICQFAELLERNGGSCMVEPEILAAEAAWTVGRGKILMLQQSEEGWDYSIMDAGYHLQDGGQLDAPQLSAVEAREEILSMHGMVSGSRVRMNYEVAVEKAEAAERQSVLAKLKTETAEHAVSVKNKGREEHHER